MSKPEKRDERKTAQLACWVDEENLRAAREAARARGEKLNRLVDRAIAREVGRGASAKDESDEA